MKIWHRARAFEARAAGCGGAAAATLATQQRTGSPSPAWSPRPPRPDLSPLLWLSTLSEHTRHLRAEPRCALLFAGAAAEANPQTVHRLTRDPRPGRGGARGGGAGTEGPLAGPPPLCRALCRFRRLRPVAGCGRRGPVLVGGFAPGPRIRAADLAARSGGGGGGDGGRGRDASPCEPRTMPMRSPPSRAGLLGYAAHKDGDPWRR